MPNYQEWIAKHLTAYVSSKAAIKGLLTFGIWGFSFIYLYPHLLKLKFPESFLPYALFVMSTFTSILVVNFLSWIFFELKHQLIKYIKKRNKRLQEQEDLAREKELINAEHEKIKIEYEYLTTKSKATLFHLYNNGNDVFEWDKNPVYDLNRRGYIKCIGEGNGKERIYELKSTVREFLSDHYKGIRNRKQDQLLSEMPAETSEFLRIFFDKEIPFGVKESDVKMEAQVFESQDDLVRLEALERDSFTFILTPKFREKLLKNNLFEECFRTKVTLDKSMILYAPRTSGGGLAEGGTRY